MNDGGGFLAGVRVEGQPEMEAARLPRAEVQSASPGYFQTVGIPLLRGRFFDDRDIADREQVAVISDSMARQFFPQGRRRGRADLDRQRAIAGCRSSASSATCAARSPRQPSQTFYRPLAQAPLLTVMFLARTSGDPAALVQQMRGAVHAIDPHQPVDQFRTLNEVRSASLSAPRLTATLIGVFAGIALLITAAGLAGVIAFSVNQRSQEFGVRMALGASRASVLQLVLGQGLRLVVARPRSRRHRRHRVVEHRPRAAVRYRADGHPDVRRLSPSCSRSWRSSPACCPPAGRHPSIRWWR